MNWSFLNGLLAFAVTMIVLSTVVAALLEFAHQIRRKRERYLRAYLLGFFDTQILPMFYQQIGELAHKSLAHPETRVPTGVAKLLENPNIKWVWRLIGNRSLQAVSVIFGLLIFVNHLAHPIIAAFIIIGAAWFLAEREEKRTLEAPIDLGALGLGKLFQDKGYDLHRLNRFRQDFVDDIAKIRSDLGVSDKYITNITPTEFADALGRSNMGQLLMDAGQGRIEALVTDLLRRFDNTGASSIAEFQRQSRAWSIWIAFATAFALNINAITLLQAYFSDNDLASRVAELHSEEDLQDMASAISVAVTREYEALAADQEALATARAELEAARDDVETNQTAVAELEKEVAKLRTNIIGTVDALTDEGVPIGWRFFPFCVSDGERPTKDCAGRSRYMELYEAAAANDPEELVDLQGFIAKPWYFAENHTIATVAWLRDRSEGLTLWLFGVLLAGALIGLGGPFWFDFYRRLSALTNVARGLRLNASPSAPQPESLAAAAPPANPETDHRPKTAIDAFKEAVAARSIVALPAAPRQLLNDDGTPLQSEQESA